MSQQREEEALAWERLEQEKIDARQELLALPPKFAQERVNNILRPDLWKVDDSSEIDWDGGIPKVKDYEIDRIPKNIKGISKLLQNEDLEIVLVGAEAINVWATEYQHSTLKLSEYLPLTSKSIDFYGGRLEASLAHKIMGGKLILNQNFSLGHNSAVLLAKLNNTNFKINFFSSILGLSDREITKTRVLYRKKNERLDVRFKVSNPILCLEEKLKSLVGLSQNERQDNKYLKMSILITRHYLDCICDRIEPRIGLKLVKRIYNRAKHDDGLQVWLKHGIEIDSAVPTKTIEQFGDRQWQKFCQIELPQLRAELYRRRFLYKQITNK